MGEAGAIIGWTAGWRERYAIQHGRKRVLIDHRGHELWVYRYSLQDDYQGANGATYDATARRWIG